MGFLINDSIPLYLCKRYYSGVWRPEIRLYYTTVSIIVVPIGLGICGAGLRYHLHYLVYALGIFIVNVGALISVPIAINYVAETHALHGTASTITMTFYRLSWGVAIPFFIDGWIEEVRIGWVFGTAAFLTLASWTLVLLVIWQGTRLRGWSLVRGLDGSEAGVAVYRREVLP